LYSGINAQLAWTFGEWQNCCGFLSNL
jgi:hypothetical protein